MKMVVIKSTSSDTYICKELEGDIPSFWPDLSLAKRFATKEAACLYLFERKMDTTHLLLIEVPEDTRQEKWEMELEDAFAKASPAEVLQILSKIESRLCGYCISCGEFSRAPFGGKYGCSCPVRGSWDM